MQVSNSTSQALNAFKQNSNSGVNSSTTTKQPETKEKSLEEIVNDSATKVTISMNAQYILFEMNASNVMKTNSLAQFGLTGLTDQQNDVLSFLNGGTSDGLTLSDLGYQGKPILQLSQDEATQLVSEDGFFGVTQTSDRVAGFVLSFSGDNLDILQKGREGIVKGFEEAEKLFGGQLPEISYKTQERTLALIDEKIKSLKGEEE
ncbi:hydrogenase-4 component G [Aliarcobacter butzleri]|uniref:hydrogenase-4 component G n=1 Tax=Aliarcobacter butzleri TaxID=28197 RepID=UPI002B255B18|nr:hydrogenase-4 component G [Aliarcobacter butzleri]